MEDDGPEIVKELSLSPTFWPGNPNKETVAAMYSTLTGANLTHLVFYYVYGLFKITVIARQICYRYKMGHTKDPGFSTLNHAVKAFSQLTLVAIEKNQISGLKS